MTGRTTSGAPGGRKSPFRPCPLDDLEQMRLALELGLRDYVDKNGFRDIVVGLSGGIDSALTAALAVEALGAGAGARGVDAVALLVRRRRAATRARLAESLGIDFREIPIESIVGGVRRGAGAELRRAGRAT